MKTWPSSRTSLIDSDETTIATATATARIIALDQARAAV
jgi:hypothetical protein